VRNNRRSKSVGMGGRTARPVSTTGTSPHSCPSSGLTPGSGGVVVSSHQCTLRRLHTAFAGFVRRVKTANPDVRAGYPRFKGKARFDRVGWPKDGDGSHWLPDEQRGPLLMGMRPLIVRVTCSP
jgi:hypothetical protein